MRREASSAARHRPAAAASSARWRSRATFSVFPTLFQNQLAVEGDADAFPRSLEGGHRMLQPGRKQVHVAGHRCDAMAGGLIWQLVHGGARPRIIEGDLTDIASLQSGGRRGDIIDAADMG